jgi:nicotinate-nucleotide adenylyltransferase
MNIGIMGGSFNPIHSGHIIFADAFRRQCSLDSCYLVPASISPFKLTEKNADDIHRVHMLLLACEELQNTYVSTIELERGGISYTIDTIREFKNMFPNDKLFLLIGEDQAIQFTKWKDWQEIVANVQLCIVARNLHDVNRVSIDDTLSVDNAYTKPIWLDIPVIDISSSLIRSHIEHGNDIHGLVPMQVEIYIHSYSLYT